MIYRNLSGNYGYGQHQYERNSNTEIVKKSICEKIKNNRSEIEKMKNLLLLACFMAHAVTCQGKSFYAPAFLAVGNKFVGVEDKMPNIFECLEADVLGGRLGSKK